MDMYYVVGLLYYTEGSIDQGYCMIYSISHVKLLRWLNLDQWDKKSLAQHDKDKEVFN
jgi:hypothetical protein